MAIERHESISQIVNELDTWVLPRRQAAVAAFGNHHGKVVSDGRLSLIVRSDDAFPINRAWQSYYVEIDLPSDSDFLGILLTHEIRYHPEDLRSKETAQSYRRARVSDKGRNLRGVISLFEHLTDASSCLTNKFWRSLLRDCKSGIDRGDVFSLDQIKGRYLDNSQETRQRIMSELRLDNPGQAWEYMQRNLLDTLEHLLRRRVLHRVYQWKCPYCGLQNTRTLDTIRSDNPCDVCGRSNRPPVDYEWEYRVDPFVYRTLAERNGLTVLWTLGRLCTPCFGHAFCYLPEVSLYRDPADQEPVHEVDVVVLNKGRFYAGEVKLSARAFLDHQKEIDAFVEAMAFIRPDVALLAFEQYSMTEADRPATAQALGKLRGDLLSRLPPDCQLEVFVAADTPGFSDYPQDLGHRGRRVYEFLDEIARKHTT